MPGFVSDLLTVLDKLSKTNFVQSTKTTINKANKLAATGQSTIPTGTNYNGTTSTPTANAVATAAAAKSKSSIVTEKTSNPPPAPTTAPDSQNTTGTSNDAGIINNKIALQFPETIYNSRRIMTFSIWNPTSMSTSTEQGIYNEAVNSIANSDLLQTNLTAGSAIEPNKLQATKAGYKADLAANISLPLPNTLRDNQGHEWNVTEGVIGSMISSITDKSLGGISMSIGEGVGKMAEEATGAMAVAASGVKSILNGVGSTLSNVSIDQALGSLSAKSGFRKPLADPGYFQNYSGSKPRSFTMSWDMIPKSSTDAKRIFNIITSFKYYASPAIDMSGVTMFAPCFFTLDIKNKWLESLILPGQMVITDVSVDYGSEGGMMLHEVDGFPKMITFGLTFTDLRGRYQSDYNVRNPIKNSTK